MNITPYVTQINNEAAVIAQAVAAERGVKYLSVDTSSELVTVLSGVLGDRIYNLVLPQDPTYPCAVFGADSSEPVMSDGYHVMRVDTYTLHVRSPLIDGATGVTQSIAAILAAFEASSWPIEVTDAAMEYDDDTQTYVSILEVVFSIPALDTQTLPAAIVYPVDVSAEPSAFVNLTRQHVIQGIGITLITDGTETIEDVRNDLFNALLGYQVTTDYDPVEYRQGGALDGGGALTMWRETFVDGLYIQQA